MDSRVLDDIMSELPASDTSLSRELLDEISEHACDLAAKYGTAAFETFNGGRQAFYPAPNYEEGTAGVGIVPEKHYLVYLENGFASFPMTHLYGKTIRMVIDGKVIFRKVTGINRFSKGTKTYWRRGGEGELLADTAQARSWVHPGHAPVKFIADAVSDSIDDYQEDIDYAYFGGLMEWSDY